MDPRVAHVIALVDQEPSLDVGALAAAVRLSTSRLRHLFRDETATSLHAYVRKRRFQHADYLLATTLLSVKEVCCASGFRDTGHFVRAFHDTFGLSPSAHRRRVAIFDNR